MNSICVNLNLKLAVLQYTLRHFQSLFNCFCTPGRFIQFKVGNYNASQAAKTNNDGNEYRKAEGASGQLVVC